MAFLCMLCSQLHIHQLIQQISSVYNNKLEIEKDWFIIRFVAARLTCKQECAIECRIAHLDKVAWLNSEICLYDKVPVWYSALKKQSYFGYTKQCGTWKKIISDLTTSINLYSVSFHLIREEITYITDNIKTFFVQTICQ